MIKYNGLIITLVFVLFCGTRTSSAAMQIGEEMPLWSEGYLDIHHINTGQGDAAFFILPDGTTLLFDAGAHTRPPGGPREMHIKPDDSRTVGEWISRYIMHMLQGQSDQYQRLNYIMLSHFHSDHMGGLYPGIKSSESGAYKLSGVTEVGERVPFDKIIDRAWLDYNWPFPIESDNMTNYRQFLEWHIENKEAQVEQFKVGKNNQIALVYNPDEYPDFEIRNISANGKVWTGVDSNVRNHFPAVKSLREEDLPTENMCSIVFRLSYGNFDYFTGGDLIGVPPPGTPMWHDMETPVAKAIGPVDVNVTNHHAHFDAQNDFFLSALRPRVHVIQSWVVNHPAPSTLRRLLSTRLYPGPRDIFSTNLPEVTKTFIGTASNQIIDQQGHIVIRVKPNGDSYDVYILDDTAESFEIKSIHGPYKSQ